MNRIIKLIEKSFLNAEELSELLDSSEVINWEYCGESGRNYGYNWYRIETENGEFDIYSKY